MPIADARGGSIRFKSDSDGNLAYNSSGKLQIESIEWDAEDGSKVVYDFDKKEYVELESTSEAVASSPDTGKSLTVPLSTVNEFIYDTPNAATDAGLEPFLFNTASTSAALDDAVSKLTKRHEQGAYAPGMSDKEFEEWINSVADRVRAEKEKQKGWKVNGTEKSAAEREEEAEEQKLHNNAFNAYQQRGNNK